jgi:threonine synthase
MWQGVIKEFAEFLPIAPDQEPVTLLEGNTPLIKSKNLAAKLKLPCELYFKYEGTNPTGSFKDRGMTVAVTKAIEQGSRAIVCASTGNTAASAAAYAARVGIPCVIVLPHGSISQGKLSQALIHGARVVAVKGNFDVALRIVREIADQYPITLVNSVNPYRLEGQKTAAFEICRQLGSQAPDYLLLPVGNAGNITAYWRGFSEYHALGKVDRRPKLFGFQARGADPIVREKVISNPQTIATAIRIGNPASWVKALEARDESGGVILSVTDRQILAAYRMLAEYEGVFAEPASCASVAGLIKIKDNYFARGQRVVCVLTGHGLKDPATALSVAKKFEVAPAKTNAVVKACRLDKLL